MTRNQLMFVYQWFLGDRWFATGLNQFQQNESQGLDLRGLFGGGIGRHLYRSTKTDLALIGGVDFTRERYTGEDSFVTASEAIAGVELPDVSLRVSQGGGHRPFLHVSKPHDPRPHPITGGGAGSIRNHQGFLF